MNYGRPRTASEYNIQHIKRLMKKVKTKKVTKLEASEELNRKFARLKGENIGMYEEMYPEYINLFKIA